MQSYKTNSLGFPLTFKGPGSVEEYDAAAKKSGQALADAVSNTTYRSTLPEWQDAFAKAVEKEFSATRAVDQTATDKAVARSKDKDPEKVKPILERASTFVKRVLAGLDEEGRKRIAVLAQEVADKIEIDPSPSERSSGPDKDLLAKADDILKLDVATIETKVNKFTAKVPDFELVRDENQVPTRESLARLVGEYLDVVMSEV